MRRATCALKNEQTETNVKNRLNGSINDKRSHSWGPRISAYLNTSMRAEVKIKFSGMGDANIDGCACGNVATFTNLFFVVGTEETRMMAFLHHNEGDARTVVIF